MFEGALKLVQMLTDTQYSTDYRYVLLSSDKRLSGIWRRYASDLNLADSLKLMEKFSSESNRRK